MGKKKCPLCDKEYPEFAKVCPLAHCPNCGSTELSEININVVVEAGKRVVAFIVFIAAAYLAFSFLSMFKSEFLTDILDLVKAFFYLAVIMYVFHMIGWIFKVSKGVLSQYTCLNCRYVFKKPKVNVPLVEVEEKEETKLYSSDEDTLVYS